ncbi:hypothetical protein [uncultured Ruminococcus sp.]|uniref:hypothetical protein n=1 Tax=uncultured Ruminococcus sp. TaxID=165186 RepID=UPI0025CE6796|nr:hypothetical protein [uncultured Ruminococcus sp.]
MGKNNVVFITIDNIKEDYYRCINYIKAVLEHKSSKMIQEKERNLRTSIKQYLRNNIVPAKLEEPLDNENISSSIKDLNYISENIYENIHFHIRVIMSSEVGIERMCHLHYLGLLLENFSDLVLNKRLSVFIMPNTGINVYPFYDTNSITNYDIEKDFLELSSYLRLIIREELYGVIYSVSHIKKEKKDTIVESLDIERSVITYNCSPLMIFKIVNNPDTDIQVNKDESLIQDAVDNTIKKYLESDKSPSKNSEKEIMPELLDNYKLVFSNNILNEYIGKIFNLKTNYRFGFSKSKNAKIALADYIFETAYRIVRKKLENKDLHIRDYISVIKNALGNSNIFCFLVFSYILYIDKKNITNCIENFSDLAKEITDGVSQLIQNSLQHSKSHFCAVSLFVKENNSGDEKLIIKVSDISDSDIYDTFFENISNEKKYIENRILNSNDERYNICNLKDSYRSIVDFYKCLVENKEKISHEMFYNEFDENNDEGNNLWKDFREIDSSAHIGLALFSQIIKKCNGNFNVTVKDKHKKALGNVYSENYDSFMGTDYEIILPIKPINHIKFSTVTKVSYSKEITENYQSYAEFLDYSMNNADDHFKEDYTIAVLNRQKKLNLTLSIEKFSNQFVWTRFWLNAFRGLDINNKAYCFDLSKIFRYDSVLSDDTYDEMIVKGLVNAIDIYAKYVEKESKRNKNNILFAFLNLNEKFYKTLKNITVSLALKNFPENVQLFFVYENLKDNMNFYTHLIGSSYGEAICNSFNLSIENGSKSYDNRNYYNVMQLMTPFFDKLCNKVNNNVVTKYVFPFTSFIESKNGMNLFFNDISNYAEKNIVDGQGYKLPHSHTRLGNKVHIDAFYEMSFVFYRTIVANRIAFEILRMMMNNREPKVCEIVNNGNILFFGYASYSEAILISITDILRSYRENKNLAGKYLEYAIYQYNLRTESKSNEVEIQISKEVEHPKDVYVVQIVPISSTMTTFEKIWNAFLLDAKKRGRATYHLLCNYTAFWARASKDSTIDTEKFYVEDTNSKNRIVSKQFNQLSNTNGIEYIVSGFSKWEMPEKCDKCYPKDVINEVSLVETDPTSTVPSQQIHLRETSSVEMCKVDSQNNERIRGLRGFVHYGHYVRGKNHYQIYVETQKYFTEYSYKIKEWLKDLRRINNEGSNKYPCLNIIFSPEHNTNVGFSQYVNLYYFNGNAEIVSINEDKQFRTNFVCEYADLKKAIERLWDDYSHLYQVYGEDKNKPVRFFFVDDTIISGSTFHKANSFLQSLIPDKYRSNYDSNIFEKCFILVDRLSKDSQKSYISMLDNYHTYCHIDISNMRKQGDSCTCCKYKEEVKSLFRKSATNSLARYWRDKCINLEEISFDKISDNSEKNDISYLRLVLSHIVKNILKARPLENKLDIIINIFDFFVCNETERIIWCANNPCYSDLYEYWQELIKDCSDNLKIYNKYTIIECLIKVLTRPFFVYDHDFKQAILKFMIALGEKLISQKFDQIRLDDNIKKVVECIAELYSKNDMKMRFLEKVLFEAFSDLHSTYLIRKQTIDNLRYTFKSSCSSVWTAYTANVQRTIQRSSDETRSVYFEYLLLNDSDEYSESFPERDVNNCIINRLKDAFYVELFLLNGHLYFDETRRICESESESEKKEQEIEQNVYYLDRMKKIREIDNFYLWGKSEKKERKQIHKDECELYKQLYKGKNGDISIKTRYELLLKKIKDMLSCRYCLKNNDLKIAILTSYEDTENEATKKQINRKNRMSDLQVIKTICAGSDNNMDQARFKYEIKAQILTKKENSDIMERGYDVTLDQSKEPYFIIYFDNTLENVESDKLNVGRTVRKICPVYLYVEIHTDNKELPWFAMRDILSYRDSILAYLEDDFTSDVLSEYARMTLTETILNAERAISHTSMISDRKELKKLLGTDGTNFYEAYNVEAVKKNSNTEGLKNKLIPFTKELALKWAYAKNFTNTSIAKLYNHMLIYINSDVCKIMNDKSTDPMSSRLYVEEKYNDGISFAAEKIIDLLPADKNNEEDYIYSLFWQVINFEVGEELNDAMIYTHKYGGKKITYNAEYIKGIIYRIIFDALSNSPDIYDTRFVESISNHYRNMNSLVLFELKKEENSILQFLINAKNKARFNKCTVRFYMEKNEKESSDFNWFVIENTLGTDVQYKMEEIYRKLEDPIDYNDGHISMVATNEYVCKLHDLFNLPVKEMFDVVEGNKFITKLPIIRKDR